MEWLSNPWVVGVGGGVISGLLVTVVTRYLFAKRERREYRQKIATANNEIIYAIRPAVAEKVIPSNAMLDALLSATARKYEVNSDDLLPRSALANELMKEVMDNTFLSSNQKVEFCELLAGLKQAETETAVERRIEVVTVTRREGALDTSLILGVTTAMMALVTTMFVYLKDKEDFLVSGLASKYLPMLAIVAVLPIVAFMLLDMMRRVIRIRRELDEEDGQMPKKISTIESKVVGEQPPNKPMQPTP